MSEQSDKSREKIAEKLYTDYYHLAWYKKWSDLPDNEIRQKWLGEAGKILALFPDIEIEAIQDAFNNGYARAKKQEKEKAVGVIVDLQTKIEEAEEQLIKELLTEARQYTTLGRITKRIVARERKRIRILLEGCYAKSSVESGNKIRGLIEALKKEDK